MSQARTTVRYARIFGPFAAMLAAGALTSWAASQSPWWGLAATLGGYLVALLALQLGTLITALALGVRVRSVVIGVGKRLKDWSTTKRAVVLRAVPVFLSVSIAPGKAPARPRMWGAAAGSALGGLLVTAGLLLGVTQGWNAGWVVGCGLTVLHALVPRKTAASTSTGWLLLNVLRITGAQAEQLDASPLVNACVDATMDGDLATARALADALAEQHPALRTATAARILVLQAEGRFAEGLPLAMGILDDTTLTPAEAAPFFAALAGLAAATAEAGQLDKQLGTQTAENAMDAAETLGYPAYKLTGTKALVALVNNTPDQAKTLAQHALDATDEPLNRADDLATLAAAHMATGDNKSARTAIAEADAIAPWWPRVRAVKARLDIA